MITLITGVPGSGKSAAMVQLIDALAAQGRPIYVDGVPELQVPHVALSDPTKWMEEVPDGAVVVIDEVQRVWRPRGNGSAVPPSVAALETHRHRGLDFIVITQNPMQVDPNVRRLAGRHIHLRDVGMLGRWWYEAPEAFDVARYKAAPIQKRYRLPKAVFAKYRSASLHVKPERGFPRAVIAVAVCLVLGIGLGWRIWASVTARTGTAQPAAPAGGPMPAQLRADTVRPVAEPVALKPSIAFPMYDAVATRREREPLAGRGVQLEGSYSIGGVRYASFGLVIEGQRVATLSLVQLMRMGYEFEELGPCAGLLRYRERERVITCGKPAAVDRGREVASVPLGPLSAQASAAGAASVPLP